MQCYLCKNSEQKVIVILQEKYKEKQNLIIQLIEPTD